MSRLKVFLMACLAFVILGATYAVVLIGHGFSANEEPSAIEKLVARTVRSLSIPANARRQTNPWKPTPENLQEARDRFLASCAVCHGPDGSGVAQEGRNLYPKPPDLRAPRTQNLTDGEIHHIIRNGVPATQISPRLGRSKRLAIGRNGHRGGCNRIA